MAVFFVTFGQQYARVPHPTVPGAHPDGWFEVRSAPDEFHARTLVIGAIGTAWSFLYTEEEFDPEPYPRGCLGTISADGLRTR